MLKQEHITTQSATCRTAQGQQDSAPNAAFIGSARTLMGASQQEIESYLAQMTILGRVLAVDQAMYISYAYREFYANDTNGWLLWCEKHAERSRRDAFRMAKIGDMLWRLPADYYERHKATDIYKLEIIAGMPEHKQLKILADDAIGKMSRDEVRALAGGKPKSEPTTEEKRKAENDNMTFEDFFGGCARWEPESEEEVIEKANTMSSSVIFNGSLKALVVLEAASKLNRFSDIPSDDRRALATEMRAIAAELEASCEEA